LPSSDFLPNSNDLTDFKGVKKLTEKDKNVVSLAINELTSPWSVYAKIFYIIIA